ncbi:uncharacterized protein LOC131943581 [Physella acuta]|uniref:uncharacterized protein LOC131943581 n=1 Tax=Physella acuta TaxID=109671 RepID=UPI0027DBBD1D|nr:uncharacterized protein LOC131943581 [Physella acuta]
MKPATDHSKKYPPLRLADLWTNCSMFPPCMENLMTELRVRHRLRHHDRVQLTLFLKELGLPVHEALLLWKREYSTPVANGSSSCHHGWHGNERRYIYNIRHLYGLEGGHVNYKAHSCSAIQGRSLGCVSAGNCPFMSSQETAGASNGACGVVYDQAVTRTKCQKYLQKKLLAYKQAITPCCGDVSCKKIPHCSSSETKHNNGQCLVDKKLSTFGHNVRTTCHRNIKPKLEMNTDISSGYCGDESLKKQTLPNVLLPEVLMSNTVVEPVLAKEICTCSTNMKYSCTNLSGTLKRHLSLEHCDTSCTSVKQPRVTTQKLSSNIIDPEIPSNKSSGCKKTLYQMDDVKLKLNTLKTENVVESSETISNNKLPKMELSCEEVQNVNNTPQTQGSGEMCCCTVDIKQTSHLKKPSDFYFQCLTLTCN